MLNNPETIKIFTIITYPPNKEGIPVRINTMSRQLFQDLKTLAFKRKSPIIWIEKTVSLDGLDKSLELPSNS